ncbi:ESPR-type extended signal peptide-containing protein, partial [Phocoenobacter skyensis]
MNSIYKIVFNKATQTFTAVSELAKGATKTQSQSAKQAGTFLPKFAKIALAISMVLGFSTSAIAVTDAEFNALKQQVEALKAQKTYVHVNKTGQVQTGNNTNLDTIDGVGGAKAISSMTLGIGAKVGKSAKYGINISTESGNVVSARKGMILGGANNIVKNIDDEAEGYKKRGRVIVGGHHNTVSSGDGIILGGFNNTVANANGVTLKNGNKDNRGGAIVGGHHNVVSGGDAIALGGGTSQWADGTPAPELYNEAGGENSGVLAGHGNKTYGFNSVVLGGSQNIAGDEAKRGEIERGQEKNQAVVGGSKNKALGINAIVVGGNNNVASGRNSVAMGVRSLAAGIGSLALGGLTEKKLADLINAGDYEGIVKEYKDAFSIADITELDGMSQTAEKNVFILEKVAEFQKENQGGKAYTDGSVAIGSGTIAGKENGTEEAVAMGYRAKATGNKSMTLGFDSRAEAVNSVALGTNALVKKDAKYGINISTESGNVVSARKGMILGGANNIVKNIDDEAEGYKKRGRVIVGGHHNTVSSGDGIILGGFNNTVANANGVTLKNGNKDNRGGAIVGGHHNVVSGGDAIALGGGTSQWADGTPAPELYNEAGGENSGVLAGHGNKTYGFNSVVLGGSQNIAGDEAKRGEIERGQEKNQAVVGGSKNKALGINAIVVGGNNNVASGRNSVAMGVRSLAAGIGSLALGGLTEKKLADLINAGDYEGIVKEYKDAFSIADITELDGMSQTAEKNVFILEKVAEFQKENQGGKAYTDGSVAIGSGT